MSHYSNFSDSELVCLLQESDHHAYTEIYHRYKHVLYLHAYKKLGVREEAKDLVQDLFTVLWTNREEFTLRTSLSAYLYTAVRNRVIKKISHQNVESHYISSLQYSINEGKCITDHLVREKQLKVLIESEISTLPAKMREVFILSRKDELSHRQIASHLNLSEATVKKQVNNALKILRVRLGLFIFTLCTLVVPFLR